MIPSVVLVSWKVDQSVPFVIPLFIFWPLIFLAYLIASLIGACVPKYRETTTQIRFAIRVVAAARGLQLSVSDRETALAIKVI